MLWCPMVSLYAVSCYAVLVCVGANVTQGETALHMAIIKRNKSLVTSLVRLMFPLKNSLM